MKFNLPNSVHDEILTKYPQAVVLTQHVINTGTLSIGSVIVNHPNIPPTIVTEEMLSNNFPSLHESFLWYVI